MIPLEDRVGLPEVVRAELDELLAAQHTLEDVIRRLLLAGRRVESIVVQDEYTHDVVVPYREHWLVYDTT